ncbi:uncharacterized protein LAESUDRAFT_729564 [Laetiporus sulphureus 93-53]|uniref:DUF6534 domain-containing protein n=1 Tax=Laetiporus sulphureus 93-53 TaxID=1314785 RepID=A0A165CM39_9APHY|nr:uncharacterized protein LAESUDRAFT_729564 [Laetiporus sulphureus 93-53]KZT03056.1 hypothetical protein LAESUDRAFT_729564 [Laetiporus sulphureus 93-53]
MDIGPYFGALTFGILFNILLYGAVVPAYYHYALSRRKAQTWLHSYVLFLFIADTAHTAFAAAYLYDALIVHFGRITLEQLTWLSTTVPPITGIISCAVQLFFTFRVRKLSGQLWLAIMIAALAIVSMLCSLACVIALRWPGYGRYTDLQGPAVKVPAVIWLATGLAADFLITFSLVWHLKPKRTGFPSTDLLINRIIRLTIETGLLTTSWALTDLILYLASNTDTHLFFNFSLAKLYTILVMSSLNARDSWKPSYVEDTDLSWNAQAGYPDTFMSMQNTDGARLDTTMCVGRDRSQTLQSTYTTDKIQSTDTSNGQP